MAEFLNQIMPNVVALRTQLLQAFIQTLQMVGIAGSISLVLGIPFGVLLFTTKRGGILEIRYSIAVEHTVTGKNRFKIRVKRKS